jgi:hypothetical protein
MSHVWPDGIAMIRLGRPTEVGRCYRAVESSDQFQLTVDMSRLERISIVLCFFGVMVS